MLLAIAASFNVFAPHQAPPSILNPLPGTSPEEMEPITRVLTSYIIFNNSHVEKRKKKEQIERDIMIKSTSSEDYLLRLLSSYFGLSTTSCYFKMNIMLDYHQYKKDCPSYGSISGYVT